jgi:hypothetical protein
VRLLQMISTHFPSLERLNFARDREYISNRE